MKHFLTIILLPIVFVTVFGSAPQAFAVNANPPLSVTFSATPLFSEANFVPGNAVTRTVVVSNNSDSPQQVLVEAVNAVDSGGLGDTLDLLITEADTIRYQGTVGAFLRAGEVPLSLLSHGASTTYSFEVTFESAAVNDVQDKTLGFDLCVGFSGGTKNCGDTVIGSGNDTGGTTGSNVGGSTGGSVSVTGGGGIAGPLSLVIFNEQSRSMLHETTITWDTNELSTSQVIYGPASAGPYNLNLTATNFGYPLSTTEDSAKVMNHAVLLTGLVPGQTYLYRVVSRASLPTIGYEHQFTTPISLPVSAVIPSAGPTGTSTGTSTGALTTEPSPLFDVISGPAQSTPHNALPFTIFSIIVGILIAVIVLLTIRKIKVYNYDKAKTTENIDKTKVAKVDNVSQSTNQQT